MATRLVRPGDPLSKLDTRYRTPTERLRTMTQIREEEEPHIDREEEEMRARISRAEQIHPGYEYESPHQETYDLGRMRALLEEEPGMLRFIDTAQDTATRTWFEGTQHQREKAYQKLARAAQLQDSLEDRRQRISDALTYPTVPEVISNVERRMQREDPATLDEPDDPQMTEMRGLMDLVDSIKSYGMQKRGEVARQQTELEMDRKERQEEIDRLTPREPDTEPTQRAPEEDIHHQAPTTAAFLEEPEPAEPEQALHGYYADSVQTVLEAEDPDEAARTVEPSELPPTVREFVGDEPIEAKSVQEIEESLIQRNIMPEEATRERLEQMGIDWEEERDWPIPEALDWELPIRLAEGAAGAVGLPSELYPVSPDDKIAWAKEEIGDDWEQHIDYEDLPDWLPPEGFWNNTATLLGGMVPYAIAGLATGGSGALGSIATRSLNRFAPHLAQRISGTLVGRAADTAMKSAITGAATSTTRQAMTRMTQPEEFVIDEAVRDIASTTGWFAALGGTRTTVGQGARSVISKALPEAMNHGRITPELANLITHTGGAASTGASLASLDTALKYISDPDAANWEELGEDALETMLFYGGLDLLFSMTNTARRAPAGKHAVKDPKILDKRLKQQGYVEDKDVPGLYRHSETGRLMNIVEIYDHKRAAMSGTFTAVEGKSNLKTMLQNSKYADQLTGLLGPSRTGLGYGLHANHVPYNFRPMVKENLASLEPATLKKFVSPFEYTTDPKTGLPKLTINKGAMPHFKPWLDPDAKKKLPADLRLKNFARVTKRRIEELQKKPEHSRDYATRPAQMAPTERSKIIDRPKGHGVGEPYKTAEAPPHRLDRSVAPEKFKITVGDRELLVTTGKELPQYYKAELKRLGFKARGTGVKGEVQWRGSVSQEAKDFLKAVQEGRSMIGRIGDKDVHIQIPTSGETVKTRLKAERARMLSEAGFVEEHPGHFRAERTPAAEEAFQAMMGAERVPEIDITREALVEKSPEETEAEPMAATREEPVEAPAKEPVEPVAEPTPEAPEEPTEEPPIQDIPGEQVVEGPKSIDTVTKEGQVRVQLEEGEAPSKEMADKLKGKGFEPDETGRVWSAEDKKGTRKLARELEAEIDPKKAKQRNELMPQAWDRIETLENKVGQGLTESELTELKSLNEQLVPLSEKFYELTAVEDVDALTDAQRAELERVEKEYKDTKARRTELYNEGKNLSEAEYMELEALRKGVQTGDVSLIHRAMQPAKSATYSEGDRVEKMSGSAMKGTLKAKQGTVVGTKAPDQKGRPQIDVQWDGTGEIQTVPTTDKKLYKVDRTTPDRGEVRARREEPIPTTAPTPGERQERPLNQLERSVDVGEDNISITFRGGRPTGDVRTALQDSGYRFTGDAETQTWEAPVSEQTEELARRIDRGEEELTPSPDFPEEVTINLEEVKDKEGWELSFEEFRAVRAHDDPQLADLHWTEHLDAWESVLNRAPEEEVPSENWDQLEALQTGAIEPAREVFVEEPEVDIPAVPTEEPQEIPTTIEIAADQVGNPQEIDNMSEALSTLGVVYDLHNEDLLVDPQMEFDTAIEQIEAAVDNYQAGNPSENLEGNSRELQEIMEEIPELGEDPNPIIETLSNIQEYVEGEMARITAPPEEPKKKPKTPKETKKPKTPKETKKPKTEVKPMTKEEVTELKTSVVKTLRDKGVRKEDKKIISEILEKLTSAAQKGEVRFDLVLDIVDDANKHLLDINFEQAGIVPEIDKKNIRALGKVAVELEPNLLSANMKLLLNTEKPIARTVLHEFAHVWLETWRNISPRSFNKGMKELMTVMSAGDETLELQGQVLRDTTEMAVEMMADYALTDDTGTIARNALGEEAANLRKLILEGGEELPDFKNQIFPNLPKELVTQIQDFAKGNWSKLFKKKHKFDKTYSEFHKMQDDGISQSREVYEQFAPPLYRAIEAEIDRLADKKGMVNIEQFFQQIGGKRGFIPRHKVDSDLRWSGVRQYLNQHPEKKIHKDSLKNMMGEVPVEEVTLPKDGPIQYQHMVTAYVPEGEDYEELVFTYPLDKDAVNKQWELIESMGFKLKPLGDALEMDPESITVQDYIEKAHLPSMQFLSPKLKEYYENEWYKSKIEWSNLMGHFGIKGLVFSPLREATVPTNKLTWFYTRHLEDEELKNVLSDAEIKIVEPDSSDSREALEVINKFRAGEITQEEYERQLRRTKFSYQVAHPGPLLKRQLKNMSQQPVNIETTLLGGEFEEKNYLVTLDFPDFSMHFRSHLVGVEHPPTSEHAKKATKLFQKDAEKLYELLTQNPRLSDVLPKDGHGGIKELKEAKKELDSRIGETGLSVDTRSVIKHGKEEWKRALLEYGETLLPGEQVPQAIENAAMAVFGVKLHAARKSYHFRQAVPEPDEAPPYFWARIDRVIDKHTGNKFIRIDELQSDIAAAIRDLSLKSAVLPKGYSFKKETYDGLKPKWVLRDHKQNIKGIRDTGISKEEAYAQIVDTLFPRDLPFSHTWHEYAIKRVIRKAAEEGVEGVVFVPGEVQNQRGHLSRELEGATEITAKASREPLWEDIDSMKGVEMPSPYDRKSLNTSEFMNWRDKNPDRLPYDYFVEVQYRDSKGLPNSFSERYYEWELDSALPPGIAEGVKQELDRLENKGIDVSFPRRYQEHFTRADAADILHELGDWDKTDSLEVKAPKVKKVNQDILIPTPLGLYSSRTRAIEAIQESLGPLLYDVPKVKDQDGITRYAAFVPRRLSRSNDPVTYDKYYNLYEQGTSETYEYPRFKHKEQGVDYQVTIPRPTQTDKWEWFVEDLYKHKDWEVLDNPILNSVVNSTKEKLFSPKWATEVTVDKPKKKPHKHEVNYGYYREDGSYKLDATFLKWLKPYLKQWGVKMEHRLDYVGADGQEFYGPGFYINEAMKNDVLYRGQPFNYSLEGQEGRYRDLLKKFQGKEPTEPKRYKAPDKKPKPKDLKTSKELYKKFQEKEKEALEHPKKGLKPLKDMKTRNAKMKRLGFDHTEEFRIAVEAHQLGKEAWVDKFAKMDKKQHDEIAKYVSFDLGPEQMWEALTLRIQNLDQEVYDELWEHVNQTPREFKKFTRDQVKAINDLIKLLKKRYRQAGHGKYLEPRYKEALDELLGGLDWKKVYKSEKKLQKKRNMVDYFETEVNHPITEEVLKNPEQAADKLGIHYVSPQLLSAVSELDKIPLGKMDFEDVINTLQAAIKVIETDRFKKNLHQRRRMKEILSAQNHELIRNIQRHHAVMDEAEVQAYDHLGNKIDLKPSRVDKRPKEESEIAKTGIGLLDPENIMMAIEGVDDGYMSRLYTKIADGQKGVYGDMFKAEDAITPLTKGKEKEVEKMSPYLANASGALELAISRVWDRSKKALSRGEIKRGGDVTELQNKLGNEFEKIGKQAVKEVEKDEKFRADLYDLNPILTDGSVPYLYMSEVMSLYLIGKSWKGRSTIAESGLRREAEDKLQVVAISYRDQTSISEWFKRNAPEAAKIADRMFEHINTYTRERLNEVSRKRGLFDQFVEDNYWPLIPTGIYDDLHKRLEQRQVGFGGKLEELKRLDKTVLNRGYMAQRSLEHMNFTKERQPKTDKKREGTILLQDAFKTFHQYIKDTSVWANLVEPVEEAKMLLDSPVFRQEMTERNMMHLYWNFKSFIGDLEGNMMKPVDSLETLSRRLLSKIHTSILGCNIGVTLKQPLSLFTAAGEFEHEKFLWKAVGRGMSARKRAMREFTKRDSEARMRDQGKIHREMGELGEAVEMKRFFLGQLPMISSFTEPIRAADRFAVSTIWLGVYEEAKSYRTDLEVDSDEFLDYVSRRTMQIVNRTQPTYTIHTRSEINRSHNLFSRGFYPFSTQRNTNLNAGWRDWFRYKSALRKAWGSEDGMPPDLDWGEEVKEWRKKVDKGKKLWGTPDGAPWPEEPAPGTRRKETYDNFMKKSQRLYGTSDGKPPPAPVGKPPKDYKGTPEQWNKEFKSRMNKVRKARRRMLKGLFHKFLSVGLGMYFVEDLMWRIFDYKRPEWSSPTRMASHVVTTAIGSFPGGQAIDAVAAIVDREGSFGITMEPPFYSAVNELIQFFGGTILTSSRWGDEYEAGARDGELRWRTEIIQLMETLGGVTGHFTGVPMNNINRHSRAVIKKISPQWADFPVDNFGRNIQPREYYDRLWVNLEKGDELRAKQSLYVLEHYYGYGAADSSVKSKAEVRRQVEGRIGRSWRNRYGDKKDPKVKLDDVEKLWEEVGTWSGPGDWGREEWLRGSRLGSNLNEIF